MDTLRFVCFFSLRPKVGEIIGDILSITVCIYFVYVYTYIYIYVYHSCVWRYWYTQRIH